MSEEILKERKEIDVLIEKGFIVKTKSISVLRFFKKTRNWKVKRVPLGLMDLQSELFLKLQADEEKVYSESIIERNNETVNSVSRNAKISAEIIAISVLGTKLKISLFRKWLTNYFFWRVNSKDLYNFTISLYKMNDYQNFMTSIILLKAKRTSQAIAEPTIQLTNKADMIE